MTCERTKEMWCGENNSGVVGGLYKKYSIQISMSI